MEKSIPANRPAIMRQMKRSNRPSIFPISRVTKSEAMPAKDRSKITTQIPTRPRPCSFFILEFTPPPRRRSPLTRKFIEHHQAEQQRQVKHGGVHEPLGTHVGLARGRPQ